MSRRWFVIAATLAVVIAAALVLRSCGSEAPLPPQETVPLVGDPDAAGEITLDAVIALHDANSSESWAAVAHSTTVTEGVVVVLNSDPFISAVGDGEPEPVREPVESYSDTAALAVCEAIVGEFSADTPQVRVEVRHGTEQVLVVGDIDGCAAP